MMKRTNLICIEETADFLGVKKNTQYGWVCMRKISFIKVGRLFKFDP